MRRLTATVGILALLLMVLSPRPAYAYLDPGTMNGIYQMGFYLFYSVIAFIALGFRHVKLFFVRLRQAIFGPKSPPTDTSASA